MFVVFFTERLLSSFCWDVVIVVLGGVRVGVWLELGYRWVVYSLFFILSNRVDCFRARVIFFFVFVVWVR